MTQTLLTVVAEMLAKPGKEEELGREMRALIAPTRQEEGCVQYDLHVSTGEPGRFLFFENWNSREHLDRHLKTPHLTRFLGLTGELLAEPPRIVTYTRVA